MKQSYVKPGRERKGYALHFLLLLLLIPLMHANAFAAPPNITSQPSNSTICAGSNTSFSITATNATAYQWEVNTGSGFVSVANGGVYSGATTATLTITGATAGMSGYQYRCVVTGTTPPTPAPTRTSNAATLTVYSSAPAITSQPSNKAVCAGSNTSFSVTATNTTSYPWQVNQGAGFNAVANGGVYSGATTATLTITGATASMNGYQYRVIATGPCAPPSTSNTATLTVSSISTTGSQTNVSCNGGSNGSATVNPSGGVSPYIYSWAPSGGTNATASGLSAGNYTVTVTDSIGCTATRTYTITQPPVLSVSGMQVNVSCNGGSNGSAMVNASGGTPGYTYSWAPSGGTNATATGLTAGNYTVTVTDNKGCTATLPYVITEPTAIIITGSQVNVSCNGGSNGSAVISASGGTPGYTYSWTPSGGNDTIATGLSAGTYTATVTDTNGCTATRTVTITQPDTLALSAAVTNVDCNGNSTGAINITVTGGTTPYTFSWSNGATTEDISGLTAGSYSVTVTDTNSCQVTDSMTITEPNALMLSSTITNVSCNNGSNGSIDITVTGGTTPYTFSWSNGATTEDISGLAAGTYSVTVTDTNSCQVTDSMMITEPNALMLSSTVTNVSCNNGSNGAIDITVSGGTTPYTFSWSNGATTEDISGLTAGTYSVTVTDTNSCQITDSMTITEPNALMLSSTITNVSCNNGSNGAIDITVTGGTTPYTFSWSNGATTEDISGLAAGTYSVTVTDTNSCQTTASMTITEPNALMLSSVVTNVSCNNGSNGAINITVTGGTTPYTFSWSNGATTEDISGLTAGTYSVTVTDTNSCQVTDSMTITEPNALMLSSTVTNVSCNNGSNGAINITVTGGTTPYTFSWSNGATTEDISGLAAGTYSVTVTDTNSCQITDSMTITEPNALMLSSTVTNVSCNNGSNGAIDITVTGGTTPYTFSWSNGATTEDISGLATGTYSITVTDTNSCQITDSMTITEPNALMLSSTITNVSCNNGSNGAIDITVSGGTTPYTFSWSNGATTEDISGLAAGTYSVTVTDTNSCQVTDSMTITEPNALMLSSTVTNVSCNNGSNGAINITVTGGTTPYTFSWSNGATTEDLTGLAVGTYSVTVTDTNSCQTTASITVTEPAVLALSSQVTNISCNGDSTGAADLSVSGGTAPYSFSWSNGATTEDISGLTAGSYSVTVTDTNSCSISGTITITQTPALLLSSIVTHTNCNGDSTGAIDITVTGGTVPYLYNWSNGATTEDISSLPAGTYAVTVTDSNLCSRIDTFVVNGYTSMAIAVSVSNITCTGDTNGVIDVTITGGAGGCTFSWSNGSSVEDLINIGAGTYMINVTDTIGCSLADTIIVLGPPARDSIKFEIPDTICYRSAELTLFASPAGGVFSGQGVHGNLFDPTISTGQHIITYTYMDSTACGTDTLVAMDTVWVVLCNGIDPVASAGLIQLVPNPAGGQFTLSLDGIAAKEVTVRIVEASGKLVHSGNLPVVSGSVSSRFDTSAYSKGLYFVQVVAGDKVFNQRLIVQ